MRPYFRFSFFLLLPFAAYSAASVRGEEAPVVFNRDIQSILAGNIYRVLWSSDQTTWQPLGADIAPTATGAVEFTDTALTPGTRRFYKIITPAQ